MKFLMRKKIFAFLACSAFLILTACEADPNEFGKSDYRTLKSIAFKNQTGSSAVYEETRIVKVTIDVSKAPGSLVLESFDLSSLARLHLVESAIDSMPKDSIALQKLDDSVEVSSKPLKAGDKITLPKTNVFYVATVSESGLHKVWAVHVTLRITGSSSSSVPGSSSSVKPGSSSSSAPVESSSSSIPEGSPQILSVTVNNAEVTISGTNVYIEPDYLTDLSAVTISEIVLSEGAEIQGIQTGSPYDLRRGLQAEVSNDTGSLTYTFKAGVQLPDNEFDDWNGNDLNIPPEYGIIWDNGNMSLAATTKPIAIGDGYGAEMKTGSIIGKIASGSVFTADFNPNEENLLAMAGYTDGNALIDLGKPFTARPEYLEVRFSYEGLGDSCDVYLLLENRTGNKNKDRTNSDVNKLVASAWFRTNDAADDSDPDAVSISEPDPNGMRTLLLKIRYGTPLAGSPALDDGSPLGLAKPSKGIDNSVSQGTGEEDVTHIRLVFASSAKGNLYQGIANATLVVDGFRLIY
ncbi:MAG: PCMD domain-containing protein [Fibrobacter sp.]|jgi:hypothetical protein|nr:PCMD domain-containing protein [Fibrobacter sp.]